MFSRCFHLPYKYPTHLFITQTHKHSFSFSQRPMFMLKQMYQHLDSLKISRNSMYLPSKIARIKHHQSKNCIFMAACKYVNLVDFVILCVLGLFLLIFRFAQISNSLIMCISGNVGRCCKRSYSRTKEWLGPVFPLRSREEC